MYKRQILASGKAGAAGEAIDAFKRVADTAIQTTLPDLNRRWDSANATYTSATSRAKSSYSVALDDILMLPEAERAAARTKVQRTRDQSLTTAADNRFRTRERLDSEFQVFVGDLQQAATALGNGLRAAMPIAFSDAEWAVVRGGAIPEGMLVDLRGKALGAGSLADAAGQQVLATRLAKEFADGPGRGSASPDEIRAYLAELNMDSEAFRQAFLTNLDIKAFMRWQDAAHYTPNHEADGELITAIARMMAKASNTSAQSTYPMPVDWYEKLVDSYTDYGLIPDADRYDASGVLRAKGYLLLAELMQAGQGSGATWDSRLLSQVAEETIAFERMITKTFRDFYWGDVYGNSPGLWPTAAGRSLLGPTPSLVDALSMLFDALGHDRTAALATLTSSDGMADTDLLHYLYDGRAGAQGNMWVWQDMLGSALSAATDHIGAGGPGTANYASAEIVADLVHYYATHPDLLDGNVTFHPHLADILTNHIQAVNNAGIPFAGTVSQGTASGQLLFNRIDLAVLSTADLEAVMTAMFGVDYYSHKADATKGYPLYAQIQAASDAAFRLDFLEVTANYAGNPNMLKKLAEKMGYRRAENVTALAEALQAKGLSADEANRQAQQALDWVLGFGIDKLVAKSGVGGVTGTVIGFGTDAIKEWLVNTIVPDTNYGDSATREGEALRSWAYSQGGLQLVQWLDESGLHSSGANSPQSWAARRPAEASFMVNGRLPDLTSLFAAAHATNASPGAVKQWNDFVNYYYQNGYQWMDDWGIDEGYLVGALKSRVGIP